MKGLVLSGGLSTRMGQDKGSMIYPPSRLTQRERCIELLKPYCDEVYISCREEQRLDFSAALPVIVDAVAGEGPGIGLVSAHLLYPLETFFVLACDFPYINGEDVGYLAQADAATANRSLVDDSAASFDAVYYEIEKGVIEPLFAIWHPTALEKLATDFEKRKFSPKKTLYSLKTQGVAPLSAERMVNVNDKKPVVSDGENR